MVEIIYFFCIISCSIYITEQASFLHYDHIENINKIATTWKAGINFDPDTPKDAILRLLGSKAMRDTNRVKGSFKTSDPNYVPDNFIFKYFDARIRWRHCPTIKEVRDQGNCGSCWAFSTTGAFADRLCIATKGKFKKQLSAEKLAFCCASCGCGCSGGFPIIAWKYFSNYGVVTGGGYNTTDGCQPYKVKPCLHGRKGEGSCSSLPYEENHDCSSLCYGDRSINHEEDLWTTRDYYYLNYLSIQKDVQAYGPIEATFEVYDDFLSYKSGVYTKTKNATYLSGHAVKLIGWGVEKGVDYWLMLNSWGTSWGDNGLFKIRKGTNECLVDEWMTGGVPDAAAK